MMKASVLRRLACASRVDLAVDQDGHPHDQGRARRAPSAALRRHLQARDGGCRFPGCGTTRRLHAHHVIHWEDGGASDADNLVLVCSYHHTFVHERGWTITRDPVSKLWVFSPPGKEAVSTAQRLPGASAEAVRIAAADWGLRLHEDSLVPKHWDGSGYDHDLAISVLFQQILDANGLYFAETAAPAGA